MQPAAFHSVRLAVELLDDSPFPVKNREGRTAFTTRRPNAASEGLRPARVEVGEADTIRPGLDPYPGRATAAIRDC